MDDVGTRSIFTPEQVKLNVSGFGKSGGTLIPVQDMFRESVRKFMQDTLAPQQVH